MMTAVTGILSGWLAARRARSARAAAEADRFVRELRVPDPEEPPPGRHQGPERPPSWKWSQPLGPVAYDDSLWTSPSSIAGASFMPAPAAEQAPPRMPPPGRGRFAVPASEHITIPDGPAARGPGRPAARPAAETAEMPVPPDSLSLYLDGLPRYTD